VLIQDNYIQHLDQYLQRFSDYMRLNFRINRC